MESINEWASPCVLVPKPDGTYRKCTNQEGEADNFSRFPLNEDLIDSVGQAQLISRWTC